MDIFLVTFQTLNMNFSSNCWISFFWEKKGEHFKNPKMRLPPNTNFLLSYKGYCLFEQREIGAISSCLHYRNEGTEGEGEGTLLTNEQGTGVT